MLKRLLTMNRNGVVNEGADLARVEMRLQSISLGCANDVEMVDRFRLAALDRRIEYPSQSKE